MLSFIIAAAVFGTPPAGDVDSPAIAPRALIDSAPADPGSTRQPIRLDVKIVEISHSKLQAMGLDASNLKNSAIGLVLASGSEFSIIRIEKDQKGTSFLKFLETLARNNVGEVVMAPSLTLLSGQVGIASIGTDPPTKEGTDIAVVPILLDDGSIRVELRARVSRKDHTHASESTSSPIVQEDVVHTGAELKPGQTMLVRKTRLTANTTGVKQAAYAEGTKSNADRDPLCYAETDMLFLVTASIEPHDAKVISAGTPAEPAVATPIATAAEPPIQSRGRLRLARRIR